MGFIEGVLYSFYLKVLELSICILNLELQLFSFAFPNSVLMAGAIASKPYPTPVEGIGVD
jgi:hypothetical protein